MFKRIRQRVRDLQTIKVLCSEAERMANLEGHPEPGAEHFLLSALALPDGTARNAFARISANPDQFRVAIGQQYQDALHLVGIELPPEAAAIQAAAPVATGSGLYQTQPSAQTLMHRLTREVMVKYQAYNPVAPLVGAHVILAACAAQYGVVTRALRVMGVDISKLAEAADAEIKVSQSPL